MTRFLPLVAALALSTSAFAASHADMKNIVETASEAGDFQTLLTAATEAGLADTLSNDGPFTVFAPTDEAFAALPEGTVEDLLKPENKEQLANILKYHVVSGEVMAADIAEGSSSAESLAGGALTLEKGDGVTVNGANVTTADVDASNGVIHVIDAVLLPAS